jgi:PIN domain nuclease of toxin-antitoxin system
MAEDGRLILDTHVWLWVMSGRFDELSPGALEKIERASAEGRIGIAAISVWEVAMLERLRRISLSRPVEEWVNAALRAPGTHLQELSPAIAIESTRLPGDPPRDPADRMLIASARMTGGALATRDATIIEYGKSGHVRVVDVAA